MDPAKVVEASPNASQPRTTIVAIHVLESRNQHARQVYLPSSVNRPERKRETYLSYITRAYGGTMTIGAYRYTQ